MNKRGFHRVLCILLSFVLIMSYSPMAFGTEAADTLTEKKWTNVSLYGVNVTSYGSYTADLMVDGIIGSDSNMWHTVGTTSEAYITLDLGCAKTVTKIISYARTVNETTYLRNIKDYELWLSDTVPVYNGTDGTVPDNLAATPTATGTMEKFKADTHYGTLTFPENSTGRYLTIHIKNVYGDCINIQELEVYTVDDGGFDVFVTEQKLDSSTITPVEHNVVDYGSSYTAIKLLDGTTTGTGAGWFTKVGYTSAYISFELASSELLSRMDIYPRYKVAPDRCVKDYAVYVSDTAPVYGGTNVAPTNLGTLVAEDTLEKITVTGSYGTINVSGESKGKYVTLHIKNIHGGTNIDLAEICFYSKTVEVSFTDLELDYENQKLVMPTDSDYEVSIYSSSNTDAIALDGTLNTTKGGGSEVVLKLEHKEDGSVYYTEPFNVYVRGLRQEIAEQGIIEAVDATSNHEGGHTCKYLIDGDTAGSRQWITSDTKPASAEVTLTLQEASTVTGVNLWPTTLNVQTFPSSYEIFVSSDNATWTSVAKDDDCSADQGFTEVYFDPQDNVKYVKIAVVRNTTLKYAGFAELEVMVTPPMQTIDEVATNLSVEQSGDEIVLECSELYEAVILSCTPEGLVDSEGSIDMPEKDTEVTLSIELTNRIEPTETLTVTRTVLVKSQATLDLEAVMNKTNLIPCPANDATKITLPEVPDGYAIEIVESDHPGVVDVNGNINRSDDTTYGVRLTLKVTDTATGDSRLTDPLLVPIYKTFVAPSMTQAEIDKVHAEWKTRKYGTFVHYVANQNQTMYRDGVYVGTVDELARDFDAEQFAKDMNEMGMEYVVFTVFHAGVETLFPSMTNQRWRDDRTVDPNARKTYSDRDVIMDLLDALDEYEIDLHLYTHSSLPTHVPTVGDTYWNQYVNELYYEICERYGTRLKGVWFDGLFSAQGVGEEQQHLRELCLTFNPAMILTMNTGFTEGTINPKRQNNAVDYRCWEINRYVDYEEDLELARHQVATCLAGQYWWTRIPQTQTFEMQPAEEMFRYLVAQSSISTQGGLLASTGFYAKREGESSDDLWLNGMKDMLLKVNTYLDPVAESIKGTSIGVAYPTAEGITVADLEWGVSTESGDGKNIYFHVLHAPEGNVLTLPETADGTILGESAVMMNLDGTTTEGVTIAKTENGYTLTLPEGASWDAIDTVIKAERVGYDETIPAYEGDKVFFDPTVDGLPTGKQVIREVEGKEVYLTKGESITGRLTDSCFPVKDGAKQVHFFAGEMPAYESMYIYSGSYDFYGAKAGIDPNDPEDITKPNPARASDDGETIWPAGLTRLCSTDGRITFDGFTFKGDTQLRFGYRNTEVDVTTKTLKVDLVNCRNSTAEDAYAKAPANSFIYSVDAERKIVNIKNNRFDGVSFNGVNYPMIFIRNWEGVVENNYISMKNSVNIADGSSAAGQDIFWLRGQSLYGKDWGGKQDVIIQNNWLEGRVSTAVNAMWYDEFKVHILDNTIVPTVDGYSLINVYVGGNETVDGVKKYYSNVDTADIKISGNKVINPYEMGLSFVNIYGTLTADADTQISEIQNYKAGNIKITHNDIDFGTVNGNAFGGTAVKGYDNLVFDITCNKYGETVNPVKSGLEGNFAALNVTDETAHKEVITVEDTAPTETANGVGHTVCNFCGELIAENVVIPATGEAKIGDTTYATLEEALSAAEAGQTVKLNRDVSVDFIAVDPEITLDLNGHALTAGYVIGFKGSAVIDGSADHGGKLLVPKDKMALDTANGGYLPVYEENGYIFTTVKLAGRSKFVSATQFAFSPVFETFSHEALVKGFENSNVNIIIRLTWEDEGNYRAVQDFTYLDERVARVIGSYDASEANYGLAFAASFEGSEAGKAQNVQVTAVVVSETGVEIAGTPVSFAGV